MHALVSTHLTSDNVYDRLFQSHRPRIEGKHPSQYIELLMCEFMNSLFWEALEMTCEVIDRL